MIKIIAFILELGFVSYSLNSCNGQDAMDLQLHNFTDSSLTISNNWNDKIINETDQEPPFEMTVTSKPILIFKRSESNNENEILPKKKPILYSWWMPNMTMMGSTQSTLTLPATATPKTPNNPAEPIQETTANPSLVNNGPRSTVRPRPTLRPKTKPPSVISKSTGFPSSTLVPAISTSKTSTSPVSTKYTETTKTEIVQITTAVPSNPNGFIDTIELKKKLAFAVKKLGVVLTAAGTVGEIALGPPQKGTFSRLAGQVGSFAINAASQIGPVIKTVVKHVSRPVTDNPTKDKSLEPKSLPTENPVSLEEPTSKPIGEPTIQMGTTSDCDCKNNESKDQLKPSSPTPKVSMMMSGMMSKKSRGMSTKGSKSSGTLSTSVSCVTTMSGTFVAIILQIFCALFVIQ